METGFERPRFDSTIREDKPDVSGTHGTGREDNKDGEKADHAENDTGDNSGTTIVQCALLLLVQFIVEIEKFLLLVQFDPQLRD